MKEKKLFEKHYSRFVKEGVIKSLICGLIVGFVADFIAAFATWFVDGFNGLWLSIGVGVLAFALSTPIFYKTLFRPNAEKIAKKLDSLGLEERLVTMLQYQNDESYIANCQRQDAQVQLKNFSFDKVKFGFTKFAVCASCVAVLAVSMTTLSALAAEGRAITPHAWGEALNSALSKQDPVSVTYEVEGGGHIEGEADQMVLSGGFSLPVIAVAEDGWAFVGWDDDFEEPVRSDADIRTNVKFTAIFQEVQDDGGEGDDSEEGGSNDEPQDRPQDPNNSSGDEGDEEADSSRPSNGENSGAPQPADSSDGSDSSSGASGGHSNNGQILDGEQDYRLSYDGYYSSNVDSLTEGGEKIPDDQKEGFGSYIGSLRP